MRTIGSRDEERGVRSEERGKRIKDYKKRGKDYLSGRGAWEKCVRAEALAKE